MKKTILYFGIFLLFPFLVSKAQQSNNTLIVYTDQGRDTISKYIYGHFAEHLGRCIYDGFFVGKDSEIPNKEGIRLDVVEALREIEVPILRWPGGNFAEQYHWKDGVGPADKRRPILNMMWGNVVEDNSFGTHEFLELCELLDAEPYIAVNIASGTVRDASEWVEYVNSDQDTPMTRWRKQNGRKEPWHVKFWGIGNENWLMGGHMRAEYYTDVFKRYSTYSLGEYKIASGGIVADYDWTETFMKEIFSSPLNIGLAQGLSYHYYAVHDWGNKGSSTDFTQDEWFLSMKTTLRMEPDLEKHIAIMDKYDPEIKIGLMADEWGSWYEVEPGTNPGFLYQQNTLRNAVLASFFLNIFNNHCRRVKMANIAQTVNVLQAMVLTRESEMVKTPTFYVFKMYKVHQDAILLPFELTCSDYVNGDDKIQALSVSVSLDKSGKVHVSIVNLNPEVSYSLQCEIKGRSVIEVTGEIITADRMNALNDFSQPEEVNIKPFTNMHLEDEILKVDLPAKSVVMIELF